MPCEHVETMLLEMALIFWESGGEESQILAEVMVASSCRYLQSPLAAAKDAHLGDEVTVALLYRHAQSPLRSTENFRHETTKIYSNEYFTYTKNVKRWCWVRKHLMT